MGTKKGCEKEGTEGERVGIEEEDVGSPLLSVAEEMRNDINGHCEKKS